MYYGLCKLFFLGINDYAPLPGALLCVKKGFLLGILSANSQIVSN